MLKPLSSSICLVVGKVRNSTKATDSVASSHLSRVRENLVIGLIFLGVSASYLLFSIVRGPKPMQGYPTNELYALLATSFLHGRTDLPIQPLPELLSLPDPYDPVRNQDYRLHDASLYKGRYYLYFGVAPVITLFLPYRIMTGMDLPNRAAVPIFCIAGYLSSCALFFLLARYNGWVLPLWLQCAVTISLSSMSLVSVMLRTPWFYQVAIAAGYFFVMAGFLVLAKATLLHHAASKWLVLAGLMFGLAVGCRPHLLLICGIVLGAFAIRVRCSARPVLAMVAGMAACGILLGWYNYLRFDNPLEFGRSYQLTSFPSRPGLTYHGLELNWNTTLPAAEKFLFLAPRVDTTLPFLHTVSINPLLGRGGGFFWYEDMVGLVPAAPFALLGLFLPLFLSKRRTARGLLDGASAWLLYMMYWSGIAVLFILCAVGWVLDRYVVDFAPLFTFIGVSVIAMLWQVLRARPAKHIFSFGILAATAYGTVLNVAFAIPPLRMVLKFLRDGG